MYLFANKMPFLHNYYESVSVKNAGLLKDANLKLGAVTFLYGPNGAGKSTLLKGLKAFSSVIENFMSGEPAKKPGNYFNEYCNKKEDLTVGVSYGSETRHTSLVSSFICNESEQEEINVFCKEITKDGDNQLSVQVIKIAELNKVSIGLFRNGEMIFLVDPATGQLMSGHNDKVGEKIIPNETFFNCGGYIYNENRITKSCNFVKFRNATLTLTDLNQENNNRFYELYFTYQLKLLWHFRKFVHVQPLRPILGTGDLFSLSEDNVPFQVDPQAISVTNSWLSDPEKFALNQKIIDINYVSEIPSIASGKAADSQYRKFFIHDEKLGLNLPFDKVGTGISQIVPILTSLFTPGEALLFIEQPEIHLHPAMQATLMDAILEAALSNDKQVIIETHSETFLLRALRRIREQKFPKYMFGNPGDLNENLEEIPLSEQDRNIDSIMVYYFDNKNPDSLQKQTSVKHMRLDNQGRLIDDWPGGFFEEGVREVLM